MQKERIREVLGDNMRRVAIFGTGLIGSSIGLALRQAGFRGAILGWDPEPAVLAEARKLGAIDPAFSPEANDDPFVCALAADVIVLAGPVLSIAEWLEQLAPVLSPAQLVTDVGSVKGFLHERAGSLYNGEGQPGWLPGHPMAGKEHAGPAHAEAGLFQGSAWLFTAEAARPFAAEWRGWVERFGANARTLDPAEHDRVCAFVSHVPQFVATALAARLQGECGGNAGAIREVGGRALREMTRLGASPYSMWRDIAITNETAIAAALLQMEQELAYLRENLRGPALRELFLEANRFREGLEEASISERVLAAEPVPL